MLKNVAETMSRRGAACVMHNMAGRPDAAYVDGVRDIQNIVILTGAGISAESGLATFRGPAGLWEGRRVEKDRSSR